MVTSEMIPWFFVTDGVSVLYASFSEIDDANEKARQIAGAVVYHGFLSELRGGCFVRNPSTRH